MVGSNDFDGLEDEVFGGNRKEYGGLQQGMPQGAVAIMVPMGADGVPGFPTAGFGSPPITGDEIEYHDGHKISLPRGMTPQTAHLILDRVERDNETVTRYERKFNYRPDDGAVAAARVLNARYGMVFGETLDMGFFGKRPPETRNVEIEPGKSVQVPWGLLSVPSMEGVMLTLCDRHPSPDYGEVFDVHAEGPKKYKTEIEALFDAIAQELKTNSIYRGKAVVGTDQLEFMDLSGFRSEHIVFAEDVERDLNGTLWSVLRHTDALREEGLPLRRAVLLYGPYGTGKTSIGQMTAQIATENGWTFLSAKTGHDDVEDVLRTARLYEPAVVFIEDIDNETSTGDSVDTSRLLEAFDGMTAKGSELVIVMTTNHVTRIHKGMHRPGRLDAMIEVESLDRSGVERLIKAVVPEGKLAGDVDFDAVYEAMTGFYPAFVKEALTRAATFAINRLNGERGYTLTTEDLIAAAQSLHAQLRLLEEAEEGEKPDAVAAAVGRLVHGSVQEAIHGTKVTEGDYVTGTLTVPALNGDKDQ
jgi:hypothetical protein